MSLTPDAQSQLPEESNASTGSGDFAGATPSGNAATALPASGSFRNEASRLDLVLVILTLIFGALLAAFPVRNSDFWMHLASGRRILSGQFAPGVDPYSFTTLGVYWANTSWLYDVFFYWLTQLSGGADTALAGYLVVGVKAALVALIGLIMMLTSRRGASLWAPASCAAIGLLVMSPRLILQPPVFSTLFLGITVFLLSLPRFRNTGRGIPQPSRHYWWLPLLFILWVNIDEWFILGPCTVALFLLGQMVQQLFAPVRTGDDAVEPGFLGKLALVFVVSLAACLINPYHIHAFTLPSQFSTNIPRELLAGDPFLSGFLTSIFDARRFEQNAGMTSAIATYALIVMGIVSFVLTFRQGWRWWRLLLWGAFFFLGAYQVRSLLFFAVVAAPITALNLQDFAVSPAFASPRLGRGRLALSIGGRLGCCLICLLLIAFTWPGWLHGYVPDGRRQHMVGLRLEPDVSIAGAARRLAEWQTAGMVPADAHMFNWIPDLPAYFAWYQPGSEIGKGFLDYRFNLFPRAIFAEYLETRRALRESGERGATSRDLAEFLRKRDIRFLAFNWTDRLDAQLLLIVREWSDWKILYMEGNTIIVERLNRADKNPPTAPRMDPEQMAFASETLKAPEAGPGRDPQPEELVQLYLDGPPGRPQQSVSAYEFLKYYEIIRLQWPAAYTSCIEPLAWSGIAGTAACSPVVSTGAGPLTLLFSTLRTIAVLANQAPYEALMQGKEPGPTGALLLSIRYARQAIALEPNEWKSYSHLGSAYNYLLKAQENSWAPPTGNQQVTARQSLRRTQITTVMEQLLKIRPDDPVAHEVLLQIYEQLNYYDLAQEHRRHLASIIMGNGPQNAETLDAFRSRVEGMGKKLQSLEDELNKRRNAFEVAAQNRSPFERAQIAVGHGLGQHALQILLEADPSQMKGDEIKLIFELLLSQGRAAEVQLQLREEFKRFLGMSYDWFRAQAGAALGNYEEAFKALENAADYLESMCMQSAMQLSMSQLTRGDTLELVSGQRNLVDLRRQQADFLALAGMIAMERGDVEAARSAFTRSLSLCSDAKFYFESKPIVQRYLQLIDRATTTAAAK